MRKFLLSSLLMFLSSISSLCCCEETTPNLRIHDLLPNLLSPLAVEPSIPSNFVALAPFGEPNLYDWVYWGPKDVLEAYFKDEKSLNVPIIRVKLSANVAQTGPNSFNNDDDLASFLKNNTDLSKRNYKWGEYPVKYCNVNMEDQAVIMAWVGLNDPSGWVLMFNLVYPKKAGHPNKEDYELWNNLMKNTTALKDADFFKAMGQDLQDGYTLVSDGKLKLKMIAEKRQRDGLIQIVVIPEKNVSYEFEELIEGQMGAQWRYKQPLVKVYGTITYEKDNFMDVSHKVTSVFFKEVTEFSHNKEKDNDNLLIFQKEGSRTSL